MEGAALAAKRGHERELLIAHQCAAWVGAAFGGKLKPFKSYMPQEQKPLGETQSGDQVLSALMCLQDLGAPMTIEKMN
jgi:hypothetical protein